MTRTVGTFTNHVMTEKKLLTSVAPAIRIYSYAAPKEMCLYYHVSGVSTCRVFQNRGLFASYLYPHILNNYEIFREDTFIVYTCSQKFAELFSYYILYKFKLKASEIDHI